MKRILAVVVCLLLLPHLAVAEEAFEKVTGEVAYEKGYVQVFAESEGGQTRYQAKRAARIVAQQMMVEEIEGLSLDGESTVKMGNLTTDHIQTRVKGFLRGAQVVGEEYNKAEGFARVALRVYFKGKNSLYSTLAPDIRTLKFPSAPEFKPEAAAPVEEPKTYDGLIVVVTGTGFKPALANRILTEKQEILFEPSKVTPRLLVDRGCGAYTTTEDKAKTLLKAWGCTSPLVVNCSKVIRDTEAVVSAKDATVIFQQNQKNNILSEAKVVFVL